MPRVLKHLAAVVFLVLAIGCTGGGASGGLTPLPAGFKPEQRIENAGAFRLTESGIGFLEQNVGSLVGGLLGGANGGVITFPISSSTGSALFNYTVCPGGPNLNTSPPKCAVEIDAKSAALQIEPRGPHNLRIHGPLPLRLQNLPILVDYIVTSDTPIATFNGNGACSPNAQTFANIDLNVELSVEIDVNPLHSRHGYSRLKIVSVEVNEDQIESSLHINCGDSITGAVLNFLKPILLQLVTGALVGAVTGEIEQQLCQHESPALDPSCPDGTKALDGICRYGSGSGGQPKATDECASILLGIDGHLELGQLLSSISPGTKGGIDLLFAGGGEGTRDDGSDFAWGDLNPVSNGVTLGVYGGSVPVPTSKCVPLSDLPLPSNIPIPNELAANSVPNWPSDVPGPHVGVAISERFANYALSGIYNSGLLCLGISTETVPLLNSGILGILDGTVQNLALQHEKQQIAIAVRPQKPPHVTFGNGTNLDTDPLIRLKLEQATFDLYIWSLDRFIRFMTATFDLDVPMNLTVTPSGLSPVISAIGVSNGKVTNSALLRNEPADIADALSGLIGSLVGTALGGSLPVIDLNSALSATGLSLIIPDTVDGVGSPGLRKLTKGNDNYLGIFASLAVPPPQAPLRSNTSAELRRKEVHPEGLRLPTMTRDNAPSAQLVMSSDLDDGTRIIEYGYRIDEAPWHPFTRQHIVELRDDWLRLQGRHMISVRSRVAGDPLSLDPVPATVEMVVDVEPPLISVGAEKVGEVSLEVRDQVSDGERASVRVRLDAGAWSPWTRAADTKVVRVGSADEIEIEAKDEEGNLGTARQAIIRGRAPLDPSAGCGCEVAGGAREGASVSWQIGLALAAVGLGLGRRRARTASAGARRAATALRGARHAAVGLGIIAAMGVHAGCSCGNDPAVGPQECIEPDCVTLEPGLIGAYTSVAVDKSTVWVAGYAEADWVNEHSWGDLVVGTWNGKSVEWEPIDGVPEEPAVDPALFNSAGFRGGQTEAGDDVGLWTSIAIGPDGEPAVAYYDRTNRALKFAQKQGTTWSVSSVQQLATGDVGRYAKLLFVNRVPVIAYLAMAPGEDGAITSSVRLATGASAAPSDGEWRFEDVASNTTTPCRAYLCGAGTMCIKPTGRCEKPLSAISCAPACSTSQTCIDNAGAPACVEIYGSGQLDSYPDAIGDYISMASDGKGGFGLAFYDRLHGNLAIAAKAGGKWTTQIVDGETPDGIDTGDVGMGASLFIDRAGDWHLAYVDGRSEGLKYARVKSGKDIVAPEVPDNGLGIEAVPFADGQHFIGDDAKVFVTSSGEVRISYQDATSGALRFAVGTPGVDGHSWRVKALQQEGFAGAFSQIFEMNGQMLVANWWRLGGQSARGDVAILAP